MRKYPIDITADISILQLAPKNDSNLFCTEANVSFYEGKCTWAVEEQASVPSNSYQWNVIFCLNFTFKEESFILE